MTLCEKLYDFFLKSDSPILFAGSGISAQAGLPVWNTLLSNLAEAARLYDPMTRHIILERIHDEAFLNAATYYFICNKIPEAEKYKILKDQFSKYDHESISPITELPFKAIITTNYDRALHDAYAKTHGTTPIDYSLGEPALRGAAFDNDFYIARIHGKSEYPPSIVLSEQHYENLKNNDAYLNLLTHIFTRKQILFTGFSFLDPAIKNILETIRINYGTVHNGRHIAVIPKDANASFIKELESFTIEKVFYDPANSHKELWECIKDLSQKLKQKNLALTQTAYDPFSPAKQYLASCYARIKIGPKIYPLKQAIAEGIVSSLISRAGDTGTTTKEISNSVHLELGINSDEAAYLANNAIFALVRDGLCETNNDKLIWKGQTTSSYDTAIEVLSEGIINRFVVREGGKSNEIPLDCIKSALKNTILTRGWDLGASFAANKIPEALNIENIFDNVAECDHLSGNNIRKITNALYNLLKSPTNIESKLLTELGRMAFALELILQTPHNAVFHSLTLPEKIYLDANVLMPAVTYGHPFHEIYKKTIDALIQAASKSHIRINVIAYEGFLNEVTSHRRLALQEYDNNYRHKNDLKEIINQAELFGVQNINVFIGGYIMLLINNKNITFDQYLSSYAPYDNEKLLSEWLKKQGITVIYEPQMRQLDSEYPEILHTLEVAYSNNTSWKTKDAVLIKHDALQMAAINSDLKNGVKSVFVSADRRLREKLDKGRYAYLANNMVSHIGLMQLIDLLVGTQAEEQSASKLIWSMQLTDETQQIRNYLIDHALEMYDDAITMAMHEVVDDITNDIESELKHEELSLQTNNCNEKDKIIKVISSFEDKYFTRMRELIEKKYHGN